MRLEDYREAMLEAGFEEISRVGARDAASAAEASREFLELPEPPTAIFAMSNLITVGVLRTLDLAGASVP